MRMEQVVFIFWSSAMGLTLSDHQKAEVSKYVREINMTVRDHEISQYVRELNLTVRDHEEVPGPSSVSPILPVILSVVFLLSLALLTPLLIYISRKKANQRNMQKLSDIKDDILRHQENMNVKAEIQNNLDDLREIPVIPDPMTSLPSKILLQPLEDSPSLPAPHTSQPVLPPIKHSASKQIVK